MAANWLCFHIADRPTIKNVNTKLIQRPLLELSLAFLHWTASFFEAGRLCASEPVVSASLGIANINLVSIKAMGPTEI